MMKRLLFFLAILICSGMNAQAQEEPFQYDDHNKRDPLWRLVSPNGTIVTYDEDFQITDLLLEGVMASNNASQSLAIINGKIVKLNDRIGKFVVAEISSNIVILKKGDQTFELRLKKGD